LQESAVHSAKMAAPKICGPIRPHSSHIAKAGTVLQDKFHQ